MSSKTRREQLIEAYHSQKIPECALMLDNVHDPHNVAAVSRSADALGISRIYLYYTYNDMPVLNRLGHKSSASAIKWIEFEAVDDLGGFVSKKKQEGVVFLGAQKREGSIDLRNYSWPEKMILVMGSEKHGISSEVQALLDDSLHIPMVGMVESFNISVAASIFLYQIFLEKGKELDTELVNSLRGERA